MSAPYGNCNVAVDSPSCEMERMNRLLDRSVIASSIGCYLENMHRRLFPPSIRGHRDHGRRADVRHVRHHARRQEEQHHRSQRGDDERQQRAKTATDCSDQNACAADRARQARSWARLGDVLPFFEGRCPVDHDPRTAREIARDGRIGSVVGEHAHRHAMSGPVTSAQTADRLPELTTADDGTCTPPTTLFARAWITTYRTKPPATRVRAVVVQHGFDRGRVGSGVGDRGDGRHAAVQHRTVSRCCVHRRPDGDLRLVLLRHIRLARAQAVDDGEARDDRAGLHVDARIDEALDDDRVIRAGDRRVYPASVASVAAFACARRACACAAAA